MDVPSLDSDLSVLQTYCKVYAFLGIAPLFVNGEAKRRTASHVLFAIRVSLLTAMSGWGIYIRIRKGGIYHSKVANIMSCLEECGEFAFVACTYTVAVIRANRWNRFFEELRAFREVLNSAGQKYNCTENKTCHTFKVTFFFAIYIFFNVWDMLKSINDNIFVNLTFRFFMLSQLLPALLINRMMVVVKRRYSVLIKLLRISSRTMIEDEKTAVKNINLLKILLKKCYFMVEAFNDIFGGMIFLMSLTTSFTLLSCLLWFFVRNNRHAVSYPTPISFAGDDVICTVSFVIMYLTFMIIIVSSCDATEKEGRKFTDLCYSIYIKETNKYLKKEFKNLAVISEKIGPNFSAAGFFTINQMFLSTFFSTLTSYTIVCIQFSTL
nr:unnamed protein product [Callosobruchus chinensis]